MAISLVLNAKPIIEALGRIEQGQGRIERRLDEMALNLTGIENAETALETQVKRAVDEIGSLHAETVDMARQKADEAGDVEMQSRLDAIQGRMNALTSTLSTAFGNPGVAAPPQVQTGPVVTAALPGEPAVNQTQVASQAAAPAVPVTDAEVQPPAPEPPAPEPAAPEPPAPEPPAPEPAPAPEPKPEPPLAPSDPSGELDPMKVSDPAGLGKPVAE